MPRYFFHTLDGVCIEDDQGKMFADVDAAKGEGLAIFGEILRYQGDEFWKTGKFSLVVTDEARRSVVTLTAVAVEGQELDG